MSLFLTYDLKGIQSFIFSVPRLRYICGGSALIDVFDREVIPSLRLSGTELLFSGGGKGAFCCDSVGSARGLQARLVLEAHSSGLSISFGRHEDFNEASHLAGSSYPYLPGPGALDGHPCSESGLYPTKESVHPMIKKRVWQKGDRIDHHYERELLQGLPLPGGFTSDSVEFFHDVSVETASGESGCDALGRRNRWAIIAMDGNDIGSQHRVAADQYSRDTGRYTRWLSRMSRSLDGCTRVACRSAIRALVESWYRDGGKGLDTTPDGITTLPVRPLVVGGDDIIVLTHVRYALLFVREVCRAFEEESVHLAAEYSCQTGEQLWPATGGALSITAGVLFAPVSLPLASAIPYAESLLASAKGRGRKLQAEGRPTPPCVDWESVTEGLLDQPHTRRQKELRFLDGDINEIVELTRRPYTVQELLELEERNSRYSRVPGTIRQQLRSGLRQGFWDRQVFLARLGKHQRELTSDLAEGQKRPEEKRGRWRAEPKARQGGEEIRVRSNDVLDAISLLEEDSRMSWETV